MAQHSFTTHPIVLRRLQVLRTRSVNARMRRITLGGAEFGSFERDGVQMPAFVSTGFDDHVKLVFAAAGAVEGVLPVQRAQSIDWPDAPARRLRDYTPSRVDAVRGEVDLDFVLHGDGPAASWAMNAAPGDELHILGPKSSVLIPDDVEHVLLCGDETALPAIVRYLAERPVPHPVRIVIEVADAEARQDLPLQAGDTVRWVHTPHGSSSGLADAARETGLPSSGSYVWAGAESRALLPLRRWASRELGLSKSHINITGYWHDTPAEDAEVSSGHEFSGLSPVSWFAARAALSLGVLDAVADAPSTLAPLADAVRVDERALRILVRALVPTEVLTLEDGVVGLGPAGEQILDDEHTREAFDDTLHAQQLLSLVHLADALRESATPSFVRSGGHSLLETVDADADRYRELVEESIGFSFVAAGATDVIGQVGSVVTTGPGSAILAGALPNASTTIVESAGGRDALRTDAPQTELRASFDALSADAAVSALALAHRTDAEAAALIAELAGHGRRVFLIENLHDDESADDDVEHDLLPIAAVGVPRRDARDVERLVHAAGLRVKASTAIGWNHVITEVEG